MSAPWQIVAQREISVKLRDKNFIMSVLVMLLIICVSFGIQIFMANKTETTKVAVTQSKSEAGLDGAAVVKGAEKIAKESDKKVKYEAVPVASEKEARAKVESGDADVALTPAKSGWAILGKKSVDDGFKRYVTQAVAQETLASNATRDHVDLTKLSAGTAVTSSAMEGDGDKVGVALVTSFVFVFLFYIASMLFGMPIAQSVVEEKQSRIVEILASAIPLKQLLAGKIIGNTIIAIGQLAVFVIVGIIGLSFTKYSDQVGMVASASGWFVVFFIAGFLVVAALYAVAGSLASRSEDMQSTGQPIMMVIFVTFFIGLIAKGTVLKVASFVPVVSTVAMPKRVVNGEASWWEALIALGISFAATYFVLGFATRLYTRTVMRGGSAISYRQAMAMKD